MPIVPALFWTMAGGYIALVLLPHGWAEIGLGIGFLAFLVLFLLALRPVSDSMLRRLEYRFPVLDPAAIAEQSRLESSTAPDFVVVLGAGTRHRRPELPALGQLQPAGLARIAEAVRILHALPNARLVTCSFGTDPVADRDWMAEAAAELGIDRIQVVSTPVPLSTRSELDAVRPFVGTATFILVTSAAHMPRAAAIAGALGLRPLHAPTDFLSRRRGAFGLRALRPTVQSLAQSERAIYELAAALHARWSRFHA